ncbi:MAG: CRISPR-associated protein Cas5 [Syntrophobacteraceae bacterium]|nr:CRISPR-associated protein Cas5 [Syntrophobacteraceae bacterium]
MENESIDNKKAGQTLYTLIFSLFVRRAAYRRPETSGHSSSLRVPSWGNPTAPD